MENTLIPKEDINQFLLIPAMEDKSEFWTRELSYAVRLGNEFKGKTAVTFETAQGPKTVETTIWSMAGQHIQLKGGMTIPLKSIIEVHF
jgi:hypothetical protein